MSKEACPNENSDCKYYPGCFSDIDHYYYPARLYRRPVEREFRQLPENKERKCRSEHDERHATEQPPIKPTLDFMREAIKRSKGEGCA
jgi:hypothetical protein